MQSNHDLNQIIIWTCPSMTNRLERKVKYKQESPACTTNLFYFCAILKFYFINPNVFV